MPRTVSRSVRYLFVAIASAALVLGGVQTVATTPAPMGLTACGWEGNPCVLEELVVKAPPSEMADAAAPLVVQPVEHTRTAGTTLPLAQS